MLVDRSGFDGYDRWPTHPGYKNPDWRAPKEEKDEYEEHWDKKAKHQDIPDEACRKRTDAQGKVISEIPDRDWYPPASFGVEREREPAETFAEYQQYRQDEWIECGNELPHVQCERFRPFERSRPTRWTDPFIDRAPQ